MSRVEENKWIKEVMLQVIKNLGSNVNEAGYELCKLAENPMSSQYYINVKFKNKNGQSEGRSILLKRPTQLEKCRLVHYIDYQFHNEILFYQMYAQPGDNFAKCFYANERSPIDSVIALENVNEGGYYPCTYVCDAPLEYTLAAFREIGRFHGKGYVMKELQREKFFDIVKRIQETRYDATYTFKNFVDIIATRAVEYLRNHGHDVTFCDKMEALLSRAFDKVLMKAVEPREPLSTLCHGDFTLSNTLFKAENEGQYRAMLIDFALCRYATPVVDLSTYLCLCCSNEMRKDKFFELMRSYHDALKEYLLEAGVSDIEKYSYDALLDDYKRGGLLGFIIASFFLSVLKGYVRDPNVVIMDWEERGKVLKQVGGDEISKILADMLLHLKDLGCLTYF
ncbi:PREDICTED: uncharacterized protein LOC105564043 [Vollenhovia emeryi]|uniref:uncharacterized protein LOC105564043 n=1 Tax=Vollenhovia emeryi TaxID=411798 RepID=UPI0005F46E35|nr:PREDICTED: uncharacterized protein LOC105564043 [Vollenhovia emeryi]